MKRHARLVMVRTAHTLVYLVFAAAVVVVVVAGWTRYRGMWRQALGS